MVARLEILKLRHRHVRLVLVTLLAYAVLVATHLGEFWPFSIYPMFSHAGNPWSRAVVRVLPADTDAQALRWDPVELTELPGEPFAAKPAGIDAIDLANFIVKTREWDDERVAGLHTMFADQLEDRKLLVFRVNGRLAEDGTVDVACVPYALLGRDEDALNPSLREVTP